MKGSIIADISLILGWVGFGILLQQPSQDVSLIQVADKVTTIGVLIYISFSLNKKVETLMKQHHDREESIRKDYLLDQQTMRTFYEDRRRQMIDQFVNELNQLRADMKQVIEYALKNR